MGVPEEQLVLVNERDEPLGTVGKLEAHRTGVLHRAFSIFLFDGSGRTLLQRRASCKYHSAGLWSNTCCGHPRSGDALLSAASRRLDEEMGISAPLREVFTFIYKAQVSESLVEHELDHVVFGDFNGVPVPNPLEVDAWRWIELEKLEAESAANPGRFTAWLLKCLPEVCARIRSGHQRHSTSVNHPAPRAG